MPGSAKGVTAAKTRCRKYIRNRGYGGSTRTAFQSSVKAVFKQISGLAGSQQRADTRLECSGQIMTAVPNLSGVEAPAEATIALTASAMTFTLADIPSDVTNLKLVIQAS